MPGLAEQVGSRALRGLELWRSRRLEIEVSGDGEWRVPSGAEPGLRHRVSLLNESCTCRSFRFSGLRCKHRWAVEFELALQQALAEIAEAAGANAPGGFGRRPS